jgi:hypothetical protein
MYDGFRHVDEWGGKMYNLAPIIVFELVKKDFEDRIARGTFSEPYARGIIDALNNHQALAKDHIARLVEFVDNFSALENQAGQKYVDKWFEFVVVAA